MSPRKITVLLVGLACVSSLALAADSKEKKQTTQKAAPATNKPADKGSEGGIILQNNQKTTQTNKAADKGSQGGIILQNNQKTSDKGAKGGIILQDNAGKSSTNMKAPAGKTAAPGS